MSQSKSTTLGLIYALFCFQFFALADVCIKWLTGSYHFSEIIFFRSLVAIITVSLPLLLSNKLSHVKTENYGMHFFRALYSALTLLFTILALKYMTLADFSAIVFTMPFFVLILAVFFLGEKLKSSLFLAIFVGFIGTLIISDPFSGEMNLGIPLVLIATFFAAMVVVQNKRMTKTESTSAITFWMGLFGIGFCLPFLPFYWQTPSLFDLTFLILVGFSRTLGNIFLSQSLKYAPASVISPLDYTTLVWAVLFGYLIWGEIPTSELYIGSTLIILSGLYLALRENLDAKGISDPVFGYFYAKWKKKRIMSS